MTRADVRALLGMVVVGALLGAVAVATSIGVQWAYTVDLAPDSTAGAVATAAGLLVLLCGQLWVVPWATRGQHRERRIGRPPSGPRRPTR